MAEDQTPENEAEKKSSPLIKNLILLAVAVLVPAVIGVAAYMALLKPRLSPPAPAETGSADDIPPFPPSMGTVVFDDMNVSVLTEDPDLVAPLLILQVALSCADGQTAALISEPGRKEYFAAEILSAHQGRTRGELNDPLVQNSILEQIRQRSNILLKRMAPNAQLSVLKAMYLKFAIMDLG
ncbi:MAG: hypothetical protein KF886_25725 [Candidatus Hydrogenedentes bacterium]|nr:hypothetical protein [Candidatus Hydrogenedentota bacterium]